MKLDLDFSVVSRFFQGLLNDFGQKKLWPVAAVLLAGIVAVPILLAKSSSPAPAPQAALPTPPPANGASIPTLSVQSTSTPSSTRLTGRAHNPFAQGSIGSSAGGAVATAANNVVSTLTGSGSTTGTSTAGTSSASSSLPSSSSSGSSSTTSSGSGSSTTGSSPTTPSGTPPSITGNAKPKPAPAGLRSTEAYQVSLSLTSGNGVDAIGSLKRLSGVPSDARPLLTELGVAQGGNRVLFAVQPGTVLSGPGSCTPGPLDCQILSLGQDQTEAVSSHGDGANTLFAITGITAARYASGAAAGRARRENSLAGQALLDNSNLQALSLFQYEPSLGYVVDLRNLTVGG